MTTCGSCGRHVDGDFPFCPYCRAELTPAPLSREQRKHVTILFCDVTGSTALGESTDPEALRALLARYFERMKRIIESHGGTVEKFIGDAVMAVFGVPVVHEDDALRAVRAARQMQAAVSELGIQTRIGVNSGEVVAGTAERLATGDPVNVAARLEQAAAPGEVLLGEETYRLVREAVEIEPIEALSLKGKSMPVTAYRLVGVRPDAERRQLATPMIGRERELQRLKLAFAQAIEDRSCQLFTVLGSAGVGKSRLSMEFLQEMDGARVVRGRCLSYGEGITYWPLTEVVRAIGAFPTDEYAAAILKSLLGETAVATSPEEIAWAARKLLEELAQERPLVVVFDDIHWGEETFLDLIEQIADLSRDAPILLLCMARPELLDKRPAWGGGKWNATVVLLEPLNREETDRLLDELGGVQDALRTRIREAAEGNPLFVEEMLALIRESETGQVTVPPTIHALLAARLDQLVPGERQVLEVGSVEGRIFHRNAVQMLSKEPTNLQSRLVGLLRKELVRPDRTQWRGDEAYRFRHLLIRDAAYEGLPKAVRAELHARFAGWIAEREEDLAELDEIVGYHLEQSARYKVELGQPDISLAERAGERLAAAGRHALWRKDMRAAHGLLERSLVLLRPIRWDPYLELDLLESRGLHLEAHAGELDAIATKSQQVGDQRGAAVVRLLASMWRIYTGNPWALDEWEREARNTISLLEAEHDREGLLRVWELIAVSAAGQARYEQAERAAEQAIAYAQSLGRPGVFELHMGLAFGPRPADEALQRLEALLKDDPNPHPVLTQAWLLAMLGRSDEAWAIGLAAANQMRELTGQEVSRLAEIAVLAGDHERAVAELRLFCDDLRSRGDLAGLSTYAPKLGRSLCKLGRYDEAGSLARVGQELGDERDVATQALWRQVQALVHSHRGQQEEAERLAQEAVEIAGGTDDLNSQGDTLTDLAEVLERAGQYHEAQQALKQALDRYDRKKNVAMVAQVTQRLGEHEHSARSV